MKALLKNDFSRLRIAVSAFDVKNINQRIVFNDTSEIEAVLKGFNSVVDVPTDMVISLEGNIKFEESIERFLIAPNVAHRIAD